MQHRSDDEHPSLLHEDRGPPPSTASVIRNHYTGKQPLSGNAEDGANDMECDRSMVFAYAHRTDLPCRKVRLLNEKVGSRNPALIRALFVALGFADAGYSLVRTGDLDRMREAQARAAAALRDAAVVEAGEGGR